MAKFKDKRFFILNDPLAPRLCPELAKEIGLNESILFLQLEFWIATSGIEKGDHKWVRRSVRELHETFCFWSIATINRIIISLLDQHLILVDDFNSRPSDNTRWFAIHLENAAKLSSIRIADPPKVLTQNETVPITHFETGAITQNETPPLTQNETPCIAQLETHPSQDETGASQNDQAHIRNNKNLKESNKRKRDTHESVCAGCEAGEHFSQFSVNDCLAYARSQDASTNPEGLAIKLHRTGEADVMIEDWLDRESAPVTVSRRAEYDQELTQQFLTAIKPKLNESVFDRWFRACRVRRETRQAVFLVPDQTAAQWIATNYYEEIEEAFAEIGLSEDKPFPYEFDAVGEVA